MRVQHVALEHTQQVWRMVEPMLQNAMARIESHSDYSLQDMKTLVVMGTWMMVVVIEDPDVIVGVVLVNYINRPNDRVAFVTFAAGKGIANKDAYSKFAAVLKVFGATTVEAAVTGSRCRLWRRVGFLDKYRIVEAKL